MVQGPGRKVAGRYVLLEPLGRGGMGAVWRARDEVLGRDVAVKELILPPQISLSEQENFCARTIREARSAARLRHPGVVTIHDVIRENGLPWIIMELIPGRSLAESLAEEGPLPPIAAARIGLRILEALRVAHAAGIVHRDVKPSNVLLEGDRVVLTDFGIAALEDDASLTRSGLILGTPAYMAPEQARGLRATEKSDLWSLGATLYAAVEGDPPFRGPNSGAVFMALASEAPTPSVKAGPLSPVIHGLLEKDPARRPSADATAELLRRIVDGLPATAFDRQSAGPTDVPPAYQRTGPRPGWTTPPPAPPVSTWPAGQGQRWPQARQESPFPQPQQFRPDERLRRQAAFMPLLMFFCGPIGVPWGTVIAVRMYRRGDRGGRFWVLSVLLGLAYLWWLVTLLVSLANAP